MSIFSATPHARRLSTSGKVRAVLALGAVLGLGTVTTLAAWTDTNTATGTFTTGVLDLKLNDSDTPVALTNLTMTAAKPGDTTFALLTVRNAGSINFGYAYTTSSTNGSDVPALNAGLNFGVSSLGTAAFGATPPTCGQTQFDAGTAITATGTKLSTNPTTAAPRALAAGQVEFLCVRAELPLTAVTGLQGKSTVVTMTVTATQQ
ncbi:TasA family protein [Frigoribacterium sp. 2-23]|uniref:TasA family protein n=1 Tax=Frigoribacterium sp. 2-23 TaxID=3415006 RepID=UPI003C6FD633